MAKKIAARKRSTTAIKKKAKTGERKKNRRTPSRTRQAFMAGPRLSISFPQDNETVSTTFTALGSVRPRTGTINGMVQTMGGGTTNGTGAAVDPATGHWTLNFTGLAPGQTHNLSVTAPSSGASDNVVFKT